MGEYRLSRKRYRDIEDDGRDRDSYRRPRLSNAEETLKRIKRDFMCIADPRSKVRLDDDISYVAKALAAEFSQADIKSGFKSHLRSCILEHPYKTPHFAAVICLANSREESIGKEILEYLVIATQAYLEQGQWRNTKLMLRFLACLSCMIEGEGVIEILEGLVGAVETLTADIQGRSGYADELSRIVLLTLPFLLAASSDILLKGMLDGIVDRLASYLNKRTVDLELLTIYDVSCSPYEQIDSLELLWKQTKELKESSWELHFVSKPWTFFEKELEEGARFKLPDLSIPTTFEGLLSLPEPFFRLYYDQSVEIVPPPTNIISSLLRDILLDTIDIFEVNRKDAARIFSNLDVYFPQDLFSPRGTPIDKLQSPDVSSTWKQEDIVVESIFARLLKLPHPPHREVYYHSLLMELCIIAPKALAPSFGRAIRTLYSKLAITDGEVSYRFYDWFAHHLSNFGFAWKWYEWIGDLKLPESHPRRVFIREVLEKELRLSYHGRIQGTIPDEYQFLIGDEPPNEELYDEASTLLEMMRQKQGQSEIIQHLANIETRAREEGLENPEFESLEILVQIVLHLGEMSFSHALNSIERNLQPLIQICNANQQARRRTISVVMDFWKYQPSIGAILLDKLLNYTVLTPVSVIEWLLVDSTFADRAFAWEISFKTIDKVNARVTRLSNQVSNLETQEMQNEPQREHFERAKKTLAGTQAEQREIFIMLVEKFPQLIDRLREKDEGEMATEDGGPWHEWWGKQWMKVIFRRYYKEVGRLTIPLREITTNKGLPDSLKEILDQVAALSQLS